MRYPQFVFVALGVALLTAAPALAGTLQSAPLVPGDLRDAVTEVYIHAVGDRVMTKSGETGTVKGIFPFSSQYSVKLDSMLKAHTYSDNDLARTKGSCDNPGFCIGDKVITKLGEIGYVKGIFPGGKRSVKLDAMLRASTYLVNDLARTKGSCKSYGFCFEDKVMTKAGETGWVKGIFPGGKRSVKLEVMLNASTYLASDLARTKGPCDSYGFCIEGQVMTKSGETGRVKGIFPNGKLSVKLEGMLKAGNYFPSDLAHD